MEKVRIKDLDCFISDGNYSCKYPRSEEFVKDGIPFVRCNNFKNNTITKEDMYYITKEKHSILQKGHLRQGDVLITTRGSLGQVVIVPKEYENANINAQIVLLRVNKEKIYNRYLMWQLKSAKVQNQIMRNKTGTALPQLPISKLEKIELFIVNNIKEQIEIATKLDKVQEIIDIRKKQIEELDELIKSQFVEIFGDVKKNDKQWEFTTLGNECILNPKKSELQNLPDDVEVSFVAMSSISEKGDIDTSIIKEYGDVKKGFTYFRENDVLFAKITPCMENGKGAVAIGLKNKFGFGSTEFHVLRPKEKINSIWLYTLTSMKSFRTQAEKNMTGSAGQKRVPISFFETYKYGNPPIELQNQFAEFVKLINKQKLKIQKSLEKTEDLYNSLMNKYFGE